MLPALLTRLSEQAVWPLIDYCSKDEVCSINLANKSFDTMDALGHEVQGQILASNAKCGVGGYGENRSFYEQFTAHFEGRSIHLGMDFWAPAGTVVRSPLAGKIHSFQFNDQDLNYGGTIIIEHEFEGKSFCLLYGHLSEDSMYLLKAGTPIQKNQRIGELGGIHENVGWPPHLHLQVISEMGVKRGDYIGVCSEAEASKWLAECPDPNLLLDVFER